MLENLLESAIERQASDLHFEIYRNYFRVRFRIDGLLYLITQGSPQLWPNLGNKIKVLANLNIAEKRLPQEGKFTFTHREIDFDCRVSLCPTILGEKIVIRLLKNQTCLLPVEQLGLSPEALEIIKNKLSTPGLIIISGPTGSGKSTSLYSILNHLNRGELNISTVEDPVELMLEGINQVSVNTPIGLDFATVLKCFLRQDPDIIMIGEIRDTITAEMAIRAAYTGHLVLTTLHTSSAAQTIMRLMDLKIPPINITDTVKIVIAQRLFRRLCPSCLAKGNCTKCNQGYQGRFALAEFLSLEEDFKQLILNQPNLQKLQHYQKEKKFLTLRQLAQNQVENGITTQQEINRILGSDAVVF